MLDQRTAWRLATPGRFCAAPRDEKRPTSMTTKTSPSSNSAAIWQRVIQFEGGLSPAAARALLKFRFSEHDHARMEQLSTKARAGTLTPSEQDELDTFERLGCV